MKKFIFSLQALLDHRIRQEHDAQNDLLEGQHYLNSILEKLHALFEQLEICHDEIQKAQRTVTDANTLTHFYQQQVQLKGQIQKEKYYLAVVQKRLEELRIKLVKAVHQRKMIETVRDKRFSEWNRELTQQEQNFLDDIAAISHTHHKKQKS